jgi:hypothetical protein
MFFIRCDRCGAESPEVEVTSVNMQETPPRTPHSPVWLYPTPKGWDRVLGKMLCARCVGRIEFVLKEKP